MRTIFTIWKKLNYTLNDAPIGKALVCPAPNHSMVIRFKMFSSIDYFIVNQDLSIKLYLP
ncbi:MAG: hypothetical protein KBF75_07290 [Saprospiraceae bacterium]|nr:hypothetical protein [Saprospiraceae bacterium]HQU96188.1 hypothetical protein [Saprospiraceae bacterium]HQW95165.1 hypothetical protein [Saprospiraceae bacterium]HRG43184.1 hypothetical protein [Saprospiraceae bacterium]